MMAEQSEQDKSEAPTPFKLNRARQKGTIARGMDLGFATSLTALLGYLWLSGPKLFSAISLTSQRAFVSATTATSGSNEILQLIGSTLNAVAQPILLLIGAVFLCVLIFEVIQTGFVFSFAPLTPDFSKLNPANGIKRLFSMRQLIETGKNITKLVVYSLLAVLVMLDAVKRAGPTLQDANGLARVLGQMGFKLLVLFVGAAIIIAAIDQLISRRDFLKRMRMSRSETRRETRDREGDSRFKQRRRQIHREYAKLSKSLKNVRGADILITNPTHYAVALTYNPKTMVAPRIVAQGADQMALRLKRIAFLYGVVVVEDRPLARNLYHRCEIDQEIPEVYFRPVAGHYRRIRNRMTSSSYA